MGSTVNLSRWFAFTVLICICWPLSVQAQSSSLKISEKTKHYNISGKTAAEFARSMSRKGPYSRQHRRRAWATATRNMTYQLVHRKSKKRCRIKAARVKMEIVYEMPKLRSTAGVSKRQRARWKKMLNLLNKHERTHGLYYRQFAKKVHRSLLKMKSASSCRGLERNAAKLVDSLSLADKKRNAKFDRADARNYRRMEKIYSGS